MAAIVLSLFAVGGPLPSDWRNMRRCYAPSEFKRALRRNAYPLRRGTVESELDGQRLAVVLRGLIARRNFRPKSLARRSGAYDIDARVTVPLLLQNVVRPLRAAGVAVDMFAITPNVSRGPDPFVAEVQHWLEQEAGVRQVWHMAPAPTQFSYVAAGIDLVAAWASSRSMNYTAMLLARVDLLWLPLAHAIIRGNFERDAIQPIAYYSKDDEVDDILHLVGWSLIKAFTTSFRTRPQPPFPSGMHKLPREFSSRVSPLLPGCAKACCNHVASIFRGTPADLRANPCYALSEVIYERFRRGIGLNDSMVLPRMLRKEPRHWGGLLVSSTPLRHGNWWRFKCNPDGRTLLAAGRDNITKHGSGASAVPRDLGRRHGGRHGSSSVIGLTVFAMAAAGGGLTWLYCRRRTGLCPPPPAQAEWTGGITDVQAMRTPGTGALAMREPAPGLAGLPAARFGFPAGIAPLA